MAVGNHQQEIRKQRWWWKSTLVTSTRAISTPIIFHT